MFRSIDRLRFSVVLTALALLFGAAVAQDAPEGTAELSVLENPEFGSHLADGQGLALYLYVEDEDGTSTCEGACANNWPPLLAADAESVSAADGIDSDLLGTTGRSDGTVQVTYAGHPLYTSHHDSEGTVKGQKVGRGVFQLVSPAGTGITEALQQEQVEVDEETLALLLEDGRRFYASNCAACHGPEGRGGVGPRVADNSIVNNTQFTVERILNGFPDHGMPAFRDILDDHQIAAITTFIRGSFGNDYGPVTEEEVAARR